MLVYVCTLPFFDTPSPTRPQEGKVNGFLFFTSLNNKTSIYSPPYSNIILIIEILVWLLTEFKIVLYVFCKDCFSVEMPNKRVNLLLRPLQTFLSLVRLWRCPHNFSVEKIGMFI
jgi:hypothetical protein